MDLDQKYDRQKDLGLKTPKSVAVVGCGGIGSWVATFLAISGVEKLFLFDGDTVERHNLNRTLFTEEDVGKPKVESLSEKLKVQRPEIEIEAYNSKYTNDSFSILGINPEVVVDCTDDIKIQRKLSKKSGFRYIRAGCTTNHYTVTSKVPDWSVKEDDSRQQCGVTIPSWIAPVTLVASFAVAKVLKTEDLEVSGEL